MAAMKKFTPRQQQYVTELRIENANLKQDLRKVQYDLGCEERAREKGEEELVNKSVRAQADLDSQFTESKDMHRALLNAVEDYLEADNSKQQTDRRYEGAMGLLGDLHYQHGQRLQNAPQLMAFKHDLDTDQWSKSQ